MMDKKKRQIAKNINALDAMGDSTASAHECTGLIPGNADSETAEEFYEQMYDFLPHGVQPYDKFSDNEGTL